MKTIDFNKLTEDEVNRIISKANKRLEDILANDRTKISDDSFGELIPFNLFTEYMLNFSICSDDGIGYYATETEKSRLPTTKEKRLSNRRMPTSCSWRKSSANWTFCAKSPHRRTTRATCSKTKWKCATANWPKPPTSSKQSRNNTTSSPNPTTGFPKKLCSTTDCSPTRCGTKCSAA